jgi:site-specific recombinase
MDLLACLASELGPSAYWLAVAFVVVVGVLLVYVGITLAAILTTRDQARAQIWCQVLRDLLNTFRSGRH